MKNFTTLIILLTLFSCKNQEKNWMLGNFSKPLENPILKPDSSYTFYCPMKKDTIKWQQADVFNPAAIVRDGKVYLLFRAEDNPKAEYAGRTSRIGLAVSDDGIHFNKLDEPVLYPSSDEFSEIDNPGGCEDPRVVVTDDGTYVLAYTSWNFKNARLSIATSKDLVHWEKHGPAFRKAYDGKFDSMWTKSGSIVTKMVNGDIIATKVNGKYLMYWGERFVNLAYSDNLIDWYPSVDEKGELIKLITPRDYKFDSEFTECGPPALITKDGILLIYNAKNGGKHPDPNVTLGIYCGGQALFDFTNPDKLIKRSDTYFIKPDLPHELTGQYSSGTTFLEGLVYFKDKWFLYYGTGDSMVGVAVSED